MLLVIEPALEQFRVIFPEEQPSTAQHRAANSMLVVGALAFSGLLANFLHHVLTSDPERMLGVIAGALVMTGGITYSWTRGIRRVPPRAALVGALTGSGLGLVPAVAFNNGFTLVFWALVGLVGGLAVDRRWTSHPGRSIVLAILAVTVVEGITLVAVHQFSPTGWFADLSRVAGWSIALLVSPAADICLSRKVRTPLFESRIQAPTLMSIDML
jgi:hypothetical protein